MLKTLQLVYGTFKHSAINQLKDNDTYVISVIAGLSQGLKYNGNFTRGVKTAVTVGLTIAAANGVYNVFLNAEKIKEYYEKEKNEK